MSMIQTTAHVISDRANRKPVLSPLSRPRPADEKKQNKHPQIHHLDRVILLQIENHRKYNVGREMKHMMMEVKNKS